MNWLSRRSVDGSARRHAALDVNLVEEEIVRRLGPKPVPDPVGNHEYGKHAAALNRTQEIGELDDDLRRIEAESTRHTHPFWILVGLAFCLVVEILGGVLILRSLGVGEGERLPLGIALGLALIGITAVASSRTATPSTSGGTSPETALTKKGLSATALVLFIYLVLVLAIAFVRLRSASDDGGGAEAIPETIVMIATAVGPAWLAEWLLKKWRPSKMLAEQLRQLRRRRRAFERERKDADAFITRFSRKETAWDDAAERLRASYVSEHRAVRAERSLPPRSSTT